MQNLNKNKQIGVVVITGASAGVGRAIANELARRGAKLGLIARGKIKLDSAVKEVKELGGDAIACAVDVSNEKELEEAARKIEERFGPIDIWINNAMVTMIGKVKDISSDEVKQVMNVNYLGSVNGILVANRRFFLRNRGHIIQIGSALAYISIPLQSAYCASKHAIHGFIQSFRIELKISRSLVKLTEVHLPGVNTPQFEWMRNHMPEHPMPVPPIFEPELMAKAVAYVIDHPRREMWVGWPAVKGILGEKFLPRLAEWKLAKEGIKSQQTSIVPRTNLNNLWQPVDHDYGAHGIFSDYARNSSIQLWLSIHREIIIVAIILFVMMMTLIFHFY